MKRRPAPGGVPVVLFHGLAVNADLWDLPSITTDRYTFRSLAELLSEAGHDVWLVNFRGYGAPHMHSTPPPGQTDWCLDHSIVYDVPAALDHVCAETGQRPFVIGCSMGAMALAAYLQGAVFLGDADARRVVAEDAIAQRRQAALAGAVFVEFPAALRWPASAYDEQGRFRWTTLLRDMWRTDGDVNYPFEILSRVGWLAAWVEAAGEVPLGWMRGRDANPADPWAGLPTGVARGLERVGRVVRQAGLGAVTTLTGHRQHRLEILELRRKVVDHIKAGTLSQFAACVRAGNFMSAVGEPKHVYSEHYDRITLPVLVLLGERDRIANARVTREVFHERVRSEDRTCLVFAEMSHGEFEAAPMATELVYPRILDWIIHRDSRARGQ